VVRDHYAVNDRETSAWDGWRAAGAEHRVRVKGGLARFDGLARRPEQPLMEMQPFWL
jgi:hypothetical protein